MEISKSQAESTAYTEAPARRRGRPVGWRARTFTGLHLLSVSDFAFVRAVISGLDPIAAYTRFQPGASTNAGERPHGHHINALAVSLKARIIEAAEGSAHELVKDAAAALRTDPGPVVATAAPAPHEPSFDEWLAGLDDPSFFREDELQAEYESHLEQLREKDAAPGDRPPPRVLTYLDWLGGLAQHDTRRTDELLGAYRAYLLREGMTPDQASALIAPIRRGRIIERQVAALSYLQTTLGSPPSPTSPTSIWFASTVTKLFDRKGVRELGHLVQFVADGGPNWARDVQGLGNTRAQSIESWLDSHATTLGAIDRSGARWKPHKRLETTLEPLQRPPPSILLSEAVDGVFAPSANQSALRPGIAPLELLLIPPELDGRHGTYRNPKPSILGVDNDLQAAMAWLSPFLNAGKLKTFIAYRREIERFYIWCIEEARVALSSVTLAHASGYQAFLRSVPEKYIGTARVTRDSPAWRPFRGQLDPKSQAYALGVLRQFYTKMMVAAYLTGNPFDSIKSAAAKGRTLDTTRSLNQEDLIWARTCVDALQLSAAAHDRIAVGEGAFDLKARVNRTILILNLFLTTGMRLDEAANAKFSHIRPALVDGVPQADEWMLPIVGKGNKIREVPISGTLYRQIERHLADAQKALAKAGEAGERRAKALQEDPPLICALRSPVASPTALMDNDAEMANDNCALSTEGLYRTLKSFFRAHASKELRLATRQWEQLRKDIASERMKGNAASAEALEASAAAVRRTMALWQRRARMSTHWLRHTFAIEVIRKNPSDAGLKLAQQLLGHASISTTGEYIKQDETAKVLAVRSVNPLNF